MRAGTDPLFSFRAPFPSGPPVAIFVGMCMRVISPTPSKNALSAAGVVLNDRLPTQTEFCRLGSFEGGRSAVFFTFSLPFFVPDLSAEAAAAPLSARFSFFRCRRCSAWESTGVSSSSASEAAESESDWALLELLSLSESAETRCLLRGCEGLDNRPESEATELLLLEEDEDDMVDGEN